MPEMKTTLKKNVLSKVQDTFEPNWWGEEADAKKDTDDKDSSQLSAIKTVGAAGHYMTENAVGMVENIIKLIHFSTTRFIYFISFKIRALVCGISSILLLKLYVIQFFFRIIRVIYLMVRRVTTYIASAINDLALLTVEVIQEAGVEVDEHLISTVTNERYDGVQVSQGPNKLHAQSFMDRIDFSDSSDDEDWSFGHSSSSFTNGTISPTEHADLIQESLANGMH